MLSASSSSRRGTPSRSNTPVPPESAELSDVPCYTCRRRHVKCDRILPKCAKCAKKGVECLGYQKPLRWAEGVAVRGKLKGKAQPVVESQSKFPSQSTSQEAEQFESQRVGSASSDAVPNATTLFELMTYHNATMCAQNVTIDQIWFINRSIEPLSFEIMQKLPKELVDCILGIAAVHMASRNPGNRQLERLALEAKADVFQSFNRILHNSELQSGDVLVCCGMLLFAMDIFEHGMDRWMLHHFGSLQVMSSLGGMEALMVDYPHLALPLVHVAHFETFWFILSQIPTTKPRQTSRRALERLLQIPVVKARLFNPCPYALTLLVWDIGDCAATLLNSRSMSTVSGLQRRDRILSTILAYQPNDGTNQVMQDYYKDIPQSENRLRNWNLVSAAWKEATTILALRYLYFGRENLEPPSHYQHLHPSASGKGAASWFTSRDDILNFYRSEEAEELGGFAGLDYQSEDFSTLRSTSPSQLFGSEPSRSAAPSPQPLELTNSGLWNSRYKIHNEALAALSSSFFTLHDTLEPVYIRYILLPLLILALVSRTGSAERALCFSFFEKFKDFMATAPASTPETDPYSRVRSSSPHGGEELEFNIPWDKLDRFSAVAEEMRGQTGSIEEEGLVTGAPEWNWWDMLNSVKMDLV